MHDVLPLYAAEPAPSPARTRIRRLSLPFQIAFVGLACAVAMGGAAVGAAAFVPGWAQVWLGADGAWLVFAGDAPPVDATAFDTLSPTTRLIAAGAFVVIAASLIAALACLAALFARYRDGDVFGPAPQRWMRRSAVALIVFALSPGALQPVLRMVGSPDRAWLHGHSLGALMVGGLLLILSLVVALGREVEREGQGFV